MLLTIAMTHQPAAYPGSLWRGSLARQLRGSLARPWRVGFDKAAMGAPNRWAVFLLDDAVARLMAMASAKPQPQRGGIRQPRPAAWDNRHPNQQSPARAK